MFQKSEFGQLNGGAGAAAWAIGPQGRTFAPPSPARPSDWRTRTKYWAEDVHLVPDLGQQIFSRQWFRGLATCFALCFCAIKLTPDFHAIPAPVESQPADAAYDEIRSQMLTPLALGANSGRHMGPSDTVAPLTSTPERPSIQVSVALGEGDSFTRALARAGVGHADIATVTGLIGSDISPDQFLDGTRIAMTLGRRDSTDSPRPLDALDFRARLDLRIQIRRVNDVLDITRIPIRVDSTPMRIQGVVSDSVYRAARAAGAPPRTIQTYLRVLSQNISLDAVGPGDRFDLIFANRRAETGENEAGELLYAGLRTRRGKRLEILHWQKGNESRWYEASGVSEQRSAIGSPVSGRLSSGFGMRMHPILGYSRMHAGIDFSAPYGSPIYAVSDGRVVYAGRHGGHGNFVRIEHGSGFGTGYAHMSRIAAVPGSMVHRGQVIGYVGSTGLSTGPHLHYEVYRNGQTVNPLSVRFAQTAQLAGSELAAFRSRLAKLKSLRPYSGTGNGPAMAGNRAGNDQRAALDAKPQG